MVLKELFDRIFQVNNALRTYFTKNFKRSLPTGDLYSDRWEKAKGLGFDEGSSIYDSTYIIGNVEVGSICWVGMFTILDGSGNLKIGNNCTISAGCHIYTHDNVKTTLGPTNQEIQRNPVVIGNNVYIVPKSIISKGIQLGDKMLVAASSFVNKSFPSNSIIAGTPAKK